ncbi:MAG: FAD-binding protein [Bacteroidetes bacterium]|nr:FAD-binding protein [Bacteroidota bacterium]
MIHQIDLIASPREASNPEALKQLAARSLSIPLSSITELKLLKRSIDARSRNIKVNLRLQAYVGETEVESPSANNSYKDVAQAKPVVIVGAGPAGLFAALRLLELGLKPILIERGKNVRERRRDLAAIHKLHVVNPDSNYCFGEGGAGTYSDGKLYTRSTKKGDVKKILQTFIEFGADPIIAVDAHPHIGTNKLPKIIENIRKKIIECGGEIHFNTRLVDFILDGNVISEIHTQEVNSGKVLSFKADAVLLATGHSARDIFELLHKKEILIEAKEFALGVRVEHPQSLIDSLQYHCTTQEAVDELRNYLPAAAYSWVEQIEGKGVYSFCMCPGGIIAPCATGPNQVVTNGWSPSKRNNPFANSGIVVSVTEEYWKKYNIHGPLAALRYQQDVELIAFNAGGKKQSAPAQRLLDFVNGKTSSDLPPCSYQPGIVSAPLHELLPNEISFRLRKAFVLVGKKMKGYLTNNAVIVATESRTSSPVRIPRDKEELHHPQVLNLYPCGEGAGYAGGIISAALDGQNCAEKIFETHRNRGNIVD